MANAVITPTIIAKEALMQLENNLVMGNLVHREYKNEFVKVGATVNIRKPVKFVTTDGATLTKQDVEEANTSIVVDQRKHVGFGFTTQDLTLSIEEYSERYIAPAMITLANTVDRALCNLSLDVWNWVGTPGQTINSFADLAEGPQRLDIMSVPTDKRNCVLSPTDHWGMVGNLTGLNIERDASPAYRRGRLGQVAGLDMYMDQNVSSFTLGDCTDAGLVDGADQETTYALSKSTNTQTLTTDQWGIGATLTDGQIFTIAGVNSVNPVSKATTGVLQQFHVVGDTTCHTTTTTDTSLTIAPAMILTGPYQNISATPADNAQITLLGTAETAYDQNMVFHKNAFALVTCPLEMPDGVSFKARESHKGLSVRVVKDYDIVADEDIIRIDCLYGVKAIYPDLATRISGTA